jgi:hypothetical protein
MDAMEQFTNAMSQEVAEGRVPTTEQGLVYLLSQVLYGDPHAAERMAAACYLYSLRTPPYPYAAPRFPIDRTN